MSAPRPGNKAALFTLFSIIVIDLVGFGIVIPVLPFYAESYGASASVLGILLTSYAGMQFLFAPLWGRLSDRIGRRPVMLMTIAGSSLALFVLGFANSLFWLFVARILGGAFGANISVATAYVTDVTNRENRTKWMGMIGASFGIGFILGPAIGGLLSPYGYSVPMLTGAAMAAVNFLYAIFVLREPSRHEAHANGVKSKTRVLQNPFVRRMCLIYFVFTCGVAQLEAIFAFFMMDRFNYDAREVAYILVMMALIMVGIQGAAIRGLAKRYGERNLLMAGVLLLCISFAVVPWTHVIPALLIPLAISSVGRGIGQPSMLSLISHATTPTTRGAVMGAFQSSASLGRFTGPVVAGILYDLYSGAPFMLASFLMLVVMMLATVLPSPHDVKLDDVKMAMEGESTQL